MHRWMNQKLDDEDHKAIAAAEKRQKRSLRFTTLSTKMKLQVDLLSDDEEDESDDQDQLCPGTTSELLLVYMYFCMMTYIYMQYLYLI